MKSTIFLSIALASSCYGFAPTSTHKIHQSSTALNGLFDNFKTGGSGNSKESLDDQWEAQQRVLKLRKGSTKERQKYFGDIEDRREKASKKQDDMWSWQTKKYKKGEDPLTEWKKRRADGTISDLENQYGDPKEVGGIPLPGASFGVGGEFGVGGKFDNGGRFDLRLPYADQGYVDDDSNFMVTLGNIFAGGKKKKVEKVAPPVPEPSKKNKWPWEK